MLDMVARSVVPVVPSDTVRPRCAGRCQGEGHGKGEAVEKELAGFEDGVMLIKDSKGTEKFNFPKQIFGPETTQEQVFASCTPELLDGFLEGQNHALLFAYGQTGTGKSAPRAVAHRRTS